MNLSKTSSRRVISFLFLVLVGVFSLTACGEQQPTNPAVPTMPIGQITSATFAPTFGTTSLIDTKPNVTPIVSATSISRTTVVPTSGITPIVNTKPTATQIISASSLSQLNTFWLKGTPCSPPCWQGIIPGQTTLEQATTILKNLSIATNIELGPLTNTKELNWDWKGTDRGGKIWFHPATPAKTVYSIATGLPGTKLGDIIAAYGEPTYISVLSGPPVEQGQSTTYSIMVMFLSKGLYMNYQSKSKPSFNSDLLMVSPVFFEPNSLEQVAKLLSLGETNVILPWQGFKSVDYYCRNVHSITTPCP